MMSCESVIMEVGLDWIYIGSGHYTDQRTILFVDSNLVLWLDFQIQYVQAVYAMFVCISHDIYNRESGLWGLHIQTHWQNPDPPGKIKTNW